MKEFIAEFGAKAVLDVKDHDRLTCLKRSIDKKNNASLTWLLLRNGADPNDALSSAVNWGSFAHLEILLAYGAKADNDYSQALFRAADRQPFGEEERKMMRLLLQNGADPNAVNTKGTAGTIWSSVGTSSNFGLYIFPLCISQFINL